MPCHWRIRARTPPGPARWHSATPIPCSPASRWIISSAFVRSLFLEHRVALAHQFGDLRAHQLKTIEHAKYSGVGVRRKWVPERRAQSFQALTPITPEGIVVTHPQGRQHGAYTIDQADPLSHQVFPFPNARASIFIGFIGDWYHRTHARFAPKPGQQRAQQQLSASILSEDFARRARRSTGTLEG